jgi:hypothetical protein
MRTRLSRGYSGGVLRMIALVTDWARGQAPQPRSGAPKAQGLRVRPIRNIIEKIAILSYFRTPAFLRAVVSFRSKVSPLRGACGTRRTNLYPAGFNPFHNPSCALRGRGLQGEMGPFSSAASFSPVQYRSHIQPWIS